MKTALPAKEDDDAHSTTSYDPWSAIFFKYLYSPWYYIDILVIFFIIIIIIRSGTPRELRGSGSRFSSRLEERAEKRKEVVDALL